MIPSYVNLDKEAKQINFLDQRFYKYKKIYYPSITTILNYYPKNKYFEDWLKDVGHNASFIAEKAATEGSQVHLAIEELLEGKKLSWVNDYGVPKYSLNVWKMILKFHNFWTTYKPELIHSEIKLFNHQHIYAGTTDLIIKLMEKKWLLDIKTSNNIHTSYHLQTAAYTEAWNDANPDNKIDNRGILWLKSNSRKPDTKNIKIKGKGWEIIESDMSLKDDFQSFLNILDIYKRENVLKPYNEIFPSEISL